MWEPIITNKTQVRIVKDKLFEIYEDLKNIEQHENGISLLSESPGVILFYFYLYRLTNNEEFYQKGCELLTNVFKTYRKHSTPLYSNGSAGFSWFLNFIIKNNIVDMSRQLFKNIDKATENALTILIKAENFDFLHGALGLALYLIKPVSQMDFSHAINQLITILYDNAEKENDDSIKWCKIRIEKDESKRVVYDLGLSHGIASIIAFLEFVIRNKLNIDKARPIMLGAIKYLLKSQLNNGQKSCQFPSVIYKDTGDRAKSKLSWCYGDLGIGISLFNASITIDDIELQAIALKIFDHCCLINTNIDETSCIKDASICHGSAGNLLIFNRMYNNTKREDYKQSARFWLTNTLNMSIHRDGIGGYKYLSGKTGWENKIGLLEGVSGVGLSLISAISTIEPDWDQCLLLS